MPSGDECTVSVIVCTHDRPAGLRRALGSVLRAADSVPSAAVEVVVVDDGSVPLTGATLGDGRLRHVAGPRSGVGAARRAGLAAAIGQFVAYCDDDDEWTPDLLGVLLGALRRHPEVALVHGDAIWRSADATTAAHAPIRVPALAAGERIHASDVLHRRSAALDVGGFDPTLGAYEDIDLWLRMDEAHRLHHVPAVVAVHDRHQGCVTAVDRPEARARLLRYHAVPRTCREHATKGIGAELAFDPATQSPPRPQLLWRSPLTPYQGFGVAARHLLLAVERAGVDVALAAPPGPAAPAFERFVKPRSGKGRLGLSIEYWQPPDPLPTGVRVVATMREDTRIPKARINALNQTADLVLLPCRQNLASFRQCGLRVPARVLPFGVDPGRFPVLDRKRSGAEPFTFGTFGAASPRKGLDVLVRAFQAAFGPEEPVRLRLKGVDAVPLPVSRDPRIEVLTGFWPHDQMLAFLRSLDAFVLPSRAEGFGLCGIEAMATGLPLIATNWSGPADYLDPADSFPLDYRLVDAAATEAHGVRYFGQWAEPDAEHLAALMRHLYEHPGEASDKGRRAAERIRSAWTWDETARRLRDDLALLASGVSPA